jgi:hypothetical protein
MSLPPAQPAYILRGHAAQIHCVSFMRQNSRLVTGDADGWIVIWSLATKRAVAVWKAHGGTLLGARSWGNDKLITCVYSPSCFLLPLLLFRCMHVEHIFMLFGTRINGSPADMGRTIS